MSGKVIDFNANTRVTKEALAAIQAHVASLTPENLESFIIIARTRESSTCRAFGLGWDSLGEAQAMLTALGQDLLHGEIFEAEQ